MAKLTPTKRNHLSSSQFGRPGKGEGPSGKGRGSFPMNDAVHQRMAISGATRSERAGNISAGTADRIKAEARAKLKGSDGGKGAQPRFKGAAKDEHRHQEARYEKAMSKSKTGGGVPNTDMKAGHSAPKIGAAPGPQTDGGNVNMHAATGHRGVNHQANHGGNGLIKAMHAHADKLHPC